MIFNSLSFILICLLPCTAAILLLEKFGGAVRIKAENVVLLLFSMLFYAWGGLRFLALLAALIAVNYVFGLLAEKNRGFAVPGVAANALLLLFFKYFNAFLGIMQSRFSAAESLGRVLMPIGISFIVFSCISYLMDIYTGKTETCRDPLKFALYVLFFPKLIQGPIVKYQDIEGQIDDRMITFDGFVCGVERFIIGLSKKVLIADILAKTSTEIFSNMYSGIDGGTAWIGILSYTLCLYMDFSGYSDMAIGMSRMMGFEIKENFNFPYLSASPGEFWRRWHISLGAFFREYLYFPLGGNRKGNVYVNLMIVFIVTGMWHGSTLIYLFWGVYHGVFVLIDRWLTNKGINERIPKILRIAGTFLIVTVGWIAFNVGTVKDFLNYVLLMLGRGVASSFTYMYYLTPRLIAIFVAVILGSMILNDEKVRQWLKKANESSLTFNIVKYVLMIVCLYLCFITSISEGYSPFLYFRF